MIRLIFLLFNVFFHISTFIETFRVAYSHVIGSKNETDIRLTLNNNLDLMLHNDPYILNVFKSDKMYLSIVSNLNVALTKIKKISSAIVEGLMIVLNICAVLLYLNFNMSHCLPSMKLIILSTVVLKIFMKMSDLLVIIRTKNVTHQDAKLLKFVVISLFFEILVHHIKSIKTIKNLKHNMWRSIDLIKYMSYKSINSMYALLEYKIIQIFNRYRKQNRSINDIRLLISVTNIIYEIIDNYLI